MERTCIAGTGGGLRRRAKARVRVVDTRPREGRGPVIVSAYIKSSTTRSSLQVAVDGLSGALTSPGQPLKIRVFSATQEGPHRPLSARRRQTCRGT
jgi:hypothetical protein